MIKVTRWEHPGPPDADALAAELAKEGLRGLVRHDRAGVSYSDHQHSYDEVRYILSGNLVITAGSEEWTLGPGDRVEVPARTRHAVRVPPGEPVVYLVATRNVPRR